MVEPYIILFTAVGIASENLMLAGLTGEGYTITRSGNWILNMFFILVFQIEILRMGCWFGNLVTEPVNGMDQWLAIGLIMSTGIRMLQELSLKNKILAQFNFDKKNFIMVVVGSAVYPFVFGCSLTWLSGYGNIKNLFIGFVLLFMMTGFLLGRYHYQKALKYLSAGGSSLVLLSAVLFIILKLSGGL
jgi:putative Mn2+ efflux pump MntP